MGGPRKFWCQESRLKQGTVSVGHGATVEGHGHGCMPLLWSDCGGRASPTASVRMGSSGDVITSLSLYMNGQSQKRTTPSTTRGLPRYWYLDHGPSSLQNSSDKSGPVYPEFPALYKNSTRGAGVNQLLLCNNSIRHTCLGRKGGFQIIFP